ncbi:hypothetical protein [Branchiibius hedensis]|uniref:hypothetical protein n=1 Tax=Branchiibius hedensis TaxID=672460 RepID=UPI000D6B59B2|nr:hypothetical protein [Branchiibius hedensis]
MASTAPKLLGTLKESGFGQSGKYAWVAAVVHNNTSYVGQTVTVNFNLLDASGAILASESQVESFSRPNEDIIVGTQVELPDSKKAARVDATLDVEAKGAFSNQPFPAMPTSVPQIREEYGQPQASFELTNPLGQAVKDPRISLLCRDAAGRINGGGVAFPELVPASGKIRVDTNLLLSGTAKGCQVYVGAPSDWDGAQSSSAETTAAAGTPEAAFRVWVEQFTAHDWVGQYKNLVTEQQALVSEASFVACRKASTTPSVAWVKAISAQDVGDTEIPGTTKSRPATRVTAELSSNGLTETVDSHWALEDGSWRWQMTAELVKSCAGK